AASTVATTGGSSGNRSGAISCSSCASDAPPITQGASRSRRDGRPEPLMWSSAVVRRQPDEKRWRTRQDGRYLSQRTFSQGSRLLSTNAGAGASAAVRPIAYDPAPRNRLPQTAE